MPPSNVDAALMLALPLALTLMDVAVRPAFSFTPAFDAIQRFVFWFAAVNLGGMLLARNQDSAIEEQHGRFPSMISAYVDEPASRMLALADTRNGD